MDSNTFPPSKQLNLQQSLSNIQTHCSNFLNNVSQTLNPLFNNNNNNNNNKSSSSSTFENPNIFSTIDSLRNQAKQALDSRFPRFNSVNKPLWARISDDGGARTHTAAPIRIISGGGGGLSTEDIEERLAGVPVYALSNSNEEFVLVSGASTGKSLGLLFCKEEDAESLLRQMKIMDPLMRKQGSKVVALALSKVFQLKVNGVAFRLIPESTQVKNALKERKTAGFADEDFNGVPVFQSKSLLLRSENKSYRPVFFRKEDLEKSLIRASRQQNRLNPALKPGDIQVLLLFHFCQCIKFSHLILKCMILYNLKVGVFEEIVKGMKESATTNWDDIVFIPPGLEVSTHETEE
ncbi:unnamed protein product [Cochlearia groenlandica]